jgi:hypothetical protein
MVAFSALIIEADQAPPILNVDKAILERMSAGFYRLVQAPNHHLDDRAIRLFPSFVKYELSLHRWQYGQHQALAKYLYIDSFLTN